MRFIGIIPARMASTRFPGKPLTLIGDRPMIRHVYDAVAASRSIWPYYIATDSPEIEDYCRREKLNYILTASTCRNGTERCLDAMRQLAMRDADDIVINVQGDEPMIRAESLDALTRAFTDGATLASLYYMPLNPSFTLDRNRVKVLVGRDGYARLFTRSAWTAPLWSMFGQHVGVYGYRRDLLPRLVAMRPVGNLEQTAWMRAGVSIRMVEIGYKTVAVDRPEDIAEVERCAVGREVIAVVEKAISR